MSSPFVLPLYEPISSPNFYTFDDVVNAHTPDTYNYSSPSLFNSLAQATISLPDIIPAPDDLLRSDTYPHPSLQPSTIGTPFDVLSNHVMGNMDPYPVDGEMDIDFGFSTVDHPGASDATHPGELCALLFLPSY